MNLSSTVSEVYVEAALKLKHDINTPKSGNSQVHFFSYSDSRCLFCDTHFIFRLLNWKRNSKYEFNSKDIIHSNPTYIRIYIRHDWLMNFLNAYQSNNTDLIPCFPCPFHWDISDISIVVHWSLSFCFQRISNCDRKAWELKLVCLKAFLKCTAYFNDFHFILKQWDCNNNRSRRDCCRWLRSHKVELMMLSTVLRQWL